MNRTALAEFLRLRRAKLRPEDVGLYAGLRRRAPGLRREEVARLEQQRAPQPSEQLLAALAGALRLTESEREYLFNVAGRTAPVADPRNTAEQAAPTLLRALPFVTGAPAVIVSNLGDVLVKNDLARALCGDPSHSTGLARSETYRWFTEPAWRRHWAEQDRARQSRYRVAALRAAYGSMGPRSRAGELVRALQEASEEFARLWELHEVASCAADHLTLVHPSLGEIELERHSLFAEDRSQALVVLLPKPGSESERKIRLLGERENGLVPAPREEIPGSGRLAGELPVIRGAG
ncbi:transcriptional regulator [Amycolatopsis carbonis]|uniref:Transcriptional regulator n=1 Tax=Amycolatopsis carbonis TaxID=715471 RepID=A0A9Y2N030_9PSEU|nr:transcriptional regulator [Amycolatopsis sp. 2-15]WIX83243.1 transcriptional regulator [Amycolatopsis sp. 2-15]